MVENTDVEIEMGIERVMREGGEDEDALFRLGILLADLLLRKLDFPRGAIHVSVPAVDVDVIFSGFAEQMRENRIAVSLSCYWNKFVPADPPHRNMTANFLPDLAPVFHQFHEGDVGAVDHLVALSSTSREPAVIIENLRRTAAKFPTSSQIALFPTTSRDDLIDLMKHANYRETPLPSIYVGLNSGNDWSPTLRDVGWSCDKSDSPHQYAMPETLQPLLQQQILSMGL
jgi:hypothetical protein